MKWDTVVKNLFILFLLSNVAIAQTKPEDFVLVQEGTLPIILSAPHGGRKPIPDALIRRGVGVDKFVTVRDSGTDVLTQKISAGLEKALGGKPYFVIARFERIYADANRPAANAYESDAAKPVYELYHRSIERARKAIDRKWGAGLLLDIHGQGAEVNTVFRGTWGGRSVKHLIDRHGDAALTGPNSIFGHLSKSEIKVHPLPGSKDAENRSFNGGYIVQTYGSRDGGRIDAIQLEFGTILRSSTQIDKTASATTAAIAAFVREYLPRTKK